jgi:hypothetical protein
MIRCASAPNGSDADEKEEDGVLIDDENGAFLIGESFIGIGDVDRATPIPDTDDDAVVGAVVTAAGDARSSPVSATVTADIA